MQKPQGRNTPDTSGFLKEIWVGKVWLAGAVTKEDSEKNGTGEVGI